MAMTKNQFAPLLLATSLAFSTASQASDDSKTYTVNNFLAPHTYFQASDKKSVFQAALLQSINTGQQEKTIGM